MTATAEAESGVEDVPILAAATPAPLTPAATGAAPPSDPMASGSDPEPTTTTTEPRGPDSQAHQPANIDSLNDFIASNRNKSTMKKTEHCLKRFREYLSVTQKENRAIHEIPPENLNVFIGGFLLNVKKTDGKDYEPDTLTSFHRAISRHLNDNNYGHDIVQSPLFKTSKKVLEMRRKQLKQGGLGNRPNRAEPLSAEQEQRLWDCGQLGTESAEPLQNAVWFFVTKLLGLRGSHEARQLQWGDLSMQNDENGAEFLEFNERVTKTRTGNSAHLRPFAPKIFPNIGNPQKCPVRAYKLFREHRPNAMMTDSAPFFLGINRHAKVGGEWYKCQPMGHDMLGSIMRRMAAGAGLQGRFSNHSVRKTMITNLLHAEVEATKICQLSGHKNVQSINNYAVASKEQQAEMCQILQGDNRPRVPALPPPTSYPNALCPITNGRSNGAGMNQNPVAINTQQQARLSSLFHGATFNGPVSFHFN